jgi:hypothetical protein
MIRSRLFLVVVGNAYFCYILGFIDVSLYFLVYFTLISHGFYVSPKVHYSIKQVICEALKFHCWHHYGFT